MFLSAARGSRKSAYIVMAFLLNWFIVPNRVTNARLSVCEAHERALDEQAGCRHLQYRQETHDYRSIASKRNFNSFPSDRVRVAWRDHFSHARSRSRWARDRSAREQPSSRDRQLTSRGICAADTQRA